jgi:N-acetylglucosamine-6-phosphate deacetylase
MRETVLIQNAVTHTPTGVIENGWLTYQGKTITGIGAGNPPQIEFSQIIKADGLNLLPGFIDVHVHGAMGYEAMDATPEALWCMAGFYAQHGVTSFLATTWTDSYERTLAALKTIASTQGQQPNGATLLGAQMEGPYLNPAKCGAQNLRYIRRADQAEALEFLDIGVTRLLALAPEYPENHWLISECLRRGITVSAAHTTASYDEMQLAFKLGLTHVTHTYNAMEGLHHRDPGTVGAVMTHPQVYCELIADNIHVHPAAMQVLLGVKGVDKVVLITDAIRGAGMPEGEYQIDERSITVSLNAARLADGTLAGSILTMETALYNLIQATRLPLSALWQTSSLNAARSIHIAHQKGSLEIGKDADLVLVDEKIQVQMTIAEGRIVYRKDS